MKIKLLLFTILFVFSAGIVVTVIVIKNKNISEVDFVAINDVVKTTEKNWGQVVIRLLLYRKEWILNWFEGSVKA